MSYINNLISASYNIIGSPYWFGEYGPDYFDSPGLIYYVYNTIGIPVGYKTIMDFYNDSVFESIGLEDKKPGDLVFYGDDGIPTDVGIYLRDGYVIICTGGNSSTKGDDDEARVYLKRLRFKSNVLDVKRHITFDSIHQSIVTDYYENTKDYETDYAPVIDNDTEMPSEMIVNFSIKTIVYDAVQDKENTIICFFEKYAELDSAGKGTILIDDSITRKVENTIQLYKDENSLEDEDLDVMEHIIESRSADVYLKFVENDSDIIYNLYGDISVYGKAPTITLQAPRLSYELLGENLNLAWRFEKDTLYAFKFKIYLNDEVIDTGVGIINSYVYSPVERNKSYSFKVEIEHPLGGTAISNTVSFRLEEEQQKNFFKNTYMIKPPEQTKMDFYSFYIKGFIKNEEYPRLESNIVLSSKRTLASPDYPANVFEAELIGEYTSGTEFLYDIEVEFQTQDNKFLIARKSFEYFNDSSNGSPNAPLIITDSTGVARTVEELMKGSIMKMIDGSDDLYDKVTPRLNVDYNFMNKTPLEVEIELFSSKELEVAVEEESDTDILMEVEIRNDMNWTIQDFLNMADLYCPGGDTTKLENLVVRKNFINKKVQL